MNTYQYHNGVLSIPARLLYEDWQVTSYSNYKKMCIRGKLVRSRDGKGKENEALLSYHDLPEELKEICVARLGHWEDVMTVNLLEPYIKPDMRAAQFFAAHRTPDGKPLPEAKQRERVLNCCILNAVKTVFEDKRVSGKMFGTRKTKIWENVSDAVNKLNMAKWPHSLPSAAKRLRERFQRYTEEGYASFIHKNEGNDHTRLIKGEVADFLLAFYSLPNKISIPTLLAEYYAVREEKEWPELTESAVYNWLYQPEQERIWMLARHGREAYAKKYEHKLQRDKSGWFPNLYWAIDGTKLDWIHFDGNKSNKMGAALRVNIIFDVFSEKIIGWSLSETEDHTDHFRAVKMAVNHAEIRPYLFTYDNQSGHKSARMQELYSNIVAQEGGTHYPHKAYKHGSPAEQILNRIQQQVINRFWFSDGQGIKVRRDDNKPNLDFILGNKEQLKTKDELRRAWEAAVNQWNNAKHPKYNATRSEVYGFEMPMSEPLQLQDILSYMWVNETKPVQYKAHGIDLKIAGQVYSFEVYNQDRTVDIEFRRVNVGKKFIVRYDPENLGVFVQLYELNGNGEKIFVANAEPKRRHVDVPVLMQEGDKQVWAIDFGVRTAEYERDLAAVKALRQRTGITPERMMEQQEMDIKFKGRAPKKEAVAMDVAEDILSRL